MKAIKPTDDDKMKCVFYQGLSPSLKHMAHFKKYDYERLDKFKKKIRK